MRKPARAARKARTFTDPAILMLRQRRGMLMQIARALGIRPQATSLWERIPPDRVLEVEKLTGIPRHVLRPDYYPPPEMPGRIRMRSPKVAVSL